MLNALISIIKTYLFKAAAGLSGIQGVVAKYLINLALKLLRKFGIQLEEKQNAKKDLKEYDKVINNPKSTEDEVRDAGTDFLK